MKSRKEVQLGLEVLEDRMALSGAFGGAVDAGIPVLTPLNFWTLQAPLTVPRMSGSPNAFTNLYNPFTNQANIQNQLQSFQAAQTAAIDHLFSEMQSLLQALHISTNIII